LTEWSVAHIATVLQLRWPGNVVILCNGNMIEGGVRRLDDGGVHVLLAPANPASTLPYGIAGTRP